MLENLKNLCELNGISGDEGSVRDYIINQLDGKAEYKIDNLGNIIAFKKGAKTPDKKVMISAHMDEVGGLVTYINQDGTLKFEAVGGVDPRVVFGRRVTVGRNNVNGVIGSKAVHMLNDDEKKTAVKFEQMNIDIGCTSKEQAEECVSLGDSVCFCSEYCLFGDGKIKGKAIDDRAGCAIMLKLIEQELQYDTYFTFVVQEEIGLRGATVAAYSVEPDYAIVLEATTAADVPNASDEKQVCKLGNGPVVSFMDRHTVYSKELYELCFDTAKEHSIPCQTKTMIAGGNDAGAIHLSKGGVKTCAISVPCRYLHSPSCVIDKNDFENTYELTKNLLDRIFNNDI
ncbi:MAG: M42 family metallopeptidase [Ruminococcus sp.]|nr:M42 family metallopeptidase [Ruminococcus sp.]